MSKKTLFIFLAFLLVVTLVTGWFVYRAKVAGNVAHPISEKSISSPPEKHPETSQDIPSVDTSDWKTYRNETLKFSVKYPGTFKLGENSGEDGHVVSFMEFDQNARDLSNQPIPGYFSPITIYYWQDINNSYLKGGEWEGEKKYTNFQDFLADSEHTFINIISETNVDGIKAYILSMPGESGYEAVMFEYAGGYYRISFPWTQKPLDENIKKQFLSSIKLLK